MANNFSSDITDMDEAASELIRYARLATEATSRFEDGVVDTGFESAVRAPLDKGEDAVIETALNRLKEEESPAYEELLSMAEDCAQTRVDAKGVHLLVLIPIMCWSRYLIPHGKISNEALKATAELFQKGWATEKATVQIGDCLLSADHLPEGLADVRHLLDRLTKKTKIYQASTSELYGKVEEVPQRETTPFHPYSPYAVAKQYGFWIVKEYREAYHMFAVNGILFNHESERRGETFVTRKITLAAGRIACGIQDKLYLGNLDSKRDWGYAKDYVECMWLMLQHDKPEDFVIATGVQHTVREFTTLAFHYVGIELEWQGSGIHEKGINKANGKVVVEVSEAFYRPTDVVNLWGDPTKARTVLGWNPQRTSYEELCRLMAEHDLKLAKAEAVVLKETAE